MGQHPDRAADGPAGARHVPVAPAPGRRAARSRAGAGGPAVLVDATLGLGGHAAALLAAHPQLTLVGLDRDPQALALAGRRLVALRRPHAPRARRLRPIADVLAELGLPRVDGVLFDLGVSSLQLDAEERGFSYSRDADLDMRMDPTTGPTAADVLNTYPGARAGAGAAGVRRGAVRRPDRRGGRRAGGPHAPLRRSGELVELLYAAVPAASRRTGGHPAKRTFQALRIEVNGELDALRRPRCPPRSTRCAVGGRIVVLAYHSLEDRIVKRELAERLDVAHAGGPAGRAARARPGAAAAGPGGRAGGRRRDRRQPAGRVGAAARGRTDR